MTRAKESQENRRQPNQERNRGEERAYRQADQMTSGPGAARAGETRNAGSRQQSGLFWRDQAGPTFWPSPFSFLRRFGEEMEHLLEDFGTTAQQSSRSNAMAQRGGGMTMRSRDEMSAWAPQVEVAEQSGQIVIRAHLPGMNKDDVTVELGDDAVILRGERRQEREEEREGFYVSEVSYGAFYREIPLPEGVNVENAQARFRDGVLEITVPAPERAPQRRQLEVQDETRSMDQTQGRAKAAGARG